MVDVVAFTVQMEKIYPFKYEFCFDIWVKHACVHAYIRTSYTECYLLEGKRQLCLALL